nr:site-specific integrase [uncultured Dongia sp.]
MAQQAAILGRAAKSDNTRRAYDADWRSFRSWCATNHFDPLPASPATIGLYIAAIGTGAGAKAPSSIERALAGISSQHRLKGFPFDRRHPAVADVLSGLKRSVRRAKRPKAALTADRMLPVIEVCGRDLAGVRDRALLLLGFSGALRRSELVGVDVEHLAETKDGYLLTLPFSKTDQDGQGAVLGIPRSPNADLCPVTAIKAWLRLADIDGGPVFRRVTRWGAVELDRLSDRSVALIVKSRAMAAGLRPVDVAKLAGHSLRAGFITTAYEMDVPEQATQKHVRHKRADTTRGYNRVASAFKGNPAKGLLG